jgi:hypothetical protein
VDNKSIIRVQKNKDNPYAMIDKRIFSNEELSWKAKGLLGYLLSRPDNWKIIIADLVKQSKDGRDSVYAGLNELIKARYIISERLRMEKGRYSSYEYTVLEEPHDITVSTTNGFSVSGLSVSGKPRSGKPATNNTDVTKTDINNKEYMAIIKKPVKRILKTNPSKYDSFYL